MLGNEFCLNEQHNDQSFHSDDQKKMQNLIIKASKELQKKMEIIGDLETKNKNLINELAHKNQEIVELKCSLMDENRVHNRFSLENKDLIDLSSIKSRPNSIKKQENTSLESENSLLKKKYKKIKARLLNLKEKCSSLQFEIQEKNISMTNLEKQNENLKKDLRELLKEKVSQKNSSLIKHEINEIREKIKPDVKIIHDDNDNKKIEGDLLDFKKEIESKNKEINLLKEKNLKMEEEIYFLKKPQKNMVQLENLKNLVMKINSQKEPQDQNLTVNQNKILENFNKCIDFNILYEKIKKFIDYFTKITCLSYKKDYCEENIIYDLKAKKIAAYIEKLEISHAENNKLKETLSFYHETFLNFESKIKENTNYYSNQLKILSSVLSKQEYIINDLLLKNQELRNKLCKKNIIPIDFQNKISNLEAKINKYQEIINKKNEEINNLENQALKIRQEYQQYEIMYRSLKIEYDQYRENIVNKFDCLKNTSHNQSGKNIKYCDLPLQNKDLNRNENNCDRSKNKENLNNYHNYHIILKFINTKLKGYNFKFNNFLAVVPKQEQNLEENILIFEKFSNFCSEVGKKNSEIYDISNQIENNIESLFLENYNLKIFLIYSLKNILKELNGKSEKEDSNLDLSNFLKATSYIKSSFADSFDDIPIAGEHESYLDFEKFQIIQLNLHNLINYIVGLIVSIKSK